MPHVLEGNHEAVRNAGTESLPSSAIPVQAELIWGFHLQVPRAEDPNPEEAARCKRQGDEAFVKKDFQGAKQAYSQSIQHSTDDPLVWANRSAACLRLDDYQSAYHDARISRVIRPTYVKVGPQHKASGLVQTGMHSLEVLQEGRP